MRWLALVIGFGWLPGSAGAEVALREVSWGEGNVVPGATIAAADDTMPFPQIRVEGASTTTVATLEAPGVTEVRYAVTGNVRYEGVEGEGYLEMWSVFPDGSQYFSRALDAAGPTGGLRGTAAWRPLLLPFQNQPGAPPPARLVVNVVLSGRGTVWLGPLKLVQYRSGDRTLASGAWWDDRTAGLVGGIWGSVLGCLGGLIGWLVSTGRARGFVLGLMGFLAVQGTLALGTGVFAWAVSQPYAVYYPLLLEGGLGLGLGLGLLPVVRRRYADQELRRMAAMDA